MPHRLTPQMVEKDLWVYRLTYNVIRLLMASLLRANLPPHRLIYRLSPTIGDIEIECSRTTDDTARSWVEAARTIPYILSILSATGVESSIVAISVWRLFGARSDIAVNVPASDRRPRILQYSMMPGCK